MKNKKGWKGKRVDTLTFKEFEWLKCFNNRCRFLPKDKRTDKGDRTCKQNVIIKIENLSKNIDLFLEEVLELTKASERRELTKPKDRKEMLKCRKDILDKIHNGVIKFLGPLEYYSEILKALEQTCEEFRKKYKSELLMGDNVKAVSKKLSERFGIIGVSVHPGLDWGEKPNIINELKLLNQQYSLKEGFVMNFDSIKKLEEVQNEKIKSIVRNIMSEDEYWLKRKKCFDKEFLKNSENKTTKKILEELKKIKEINKKRGFDKSSKEFRAKQFSKIGKNIHLTELYKRGLISDRGLSKAEVIKLYKRMVQDCPRKESFSDVEGSCECIEKVEVVESPKSFSGLDLQLTTYGEEVLNKA